MVWARLPKGLREGAEAEPAMEEPEEVTEAEGVEAEETLSRRALE